MNVLQIEGWTSETSRLEDVPGTTPRRIFTAEPTFQQRAPMCCGSMMESKGKPEKRSVVDTPAFGLAIRWELKVRRYRCKKCRRTEYEDLGPAIAKGHNYTSRAVDYVARQAPARPFSDVAIDLGSSKSTVQRVARKVWGARPTYDFSPPRFLGIDEIVLPDLGDKNDKKPRKRAVFVDLENGRLLDILMTNTEKAVTEWLCNLPEAWRVRGVSMDYEGTYRRAVQKALPNATIVADLFHIMHDLNVAFDKIRAQEMKEQPIVKLIGRIDAIRKGVQLKTRNVPLFDLDAARASALAEAIADAIDQPFATEKVPTGNKEVRELVAALREGEKTKAKRSRADDGSLLRSRRDFIVAAFLLTYPETAKAYQAKQEFQRFWETEIFDLDARISFREWDKKLPPSIRWAFGPMIGRIYKHAEIIFPYFEMPITNSPTERSNKTTRRLALISDEKLYLPALRLKARAYARLKTEPTQFHCDSCGARVANYADKVAPYMEKLPWLIYRDDDEIWLCQTCRDHAASIDPAKYWQSDIVHIKRPDKKPALTRRRCGIDFRPPSNTVSLWKVIDETFLGLPVTPPTTPAPDLFNYQAA